MFFRWHTEFAFMDTARGEHASQTESLNQALYGLTIFGDYVGDTYSRFHHEWLVENYPEVVTAWDGPGYGSGLMLSTTALASENRDALREVIRFVLTMIDPDAYPIYDEDAYSEWEWEWEAIEKEISSQWFTQSVRHDLEQSLRAITDWEGGLIPDDAEGIAALVLDTVWQGAEYPYWESATSLVVVGLDAEWVEQTVRELLNEYADTFVPRQDETLGGV